MSEDASPNRSVIIAFLFGGFLLLLVSMLAQRLQNAPRRTIPAFQFASDNPPITNPVTIRFVTNASLTLGDQGWTAANLHPHVLVDANLVMPMGSDIAPISHDTFSLRLAYLTPGAHAVRIFWADGSHRPVGDTAATVLNVTR